MCLLSKCFCLLFQGPAVYAGYGRLKEDFDPAVDYNNTVCLIRYGKLNPFYMVRSIFFKRSPVVCETVSSFQSLP